MAPGIPEDIFARWTRIMVQKRQIFEKKKIETTKDCVLGHIWTIVELNTDVLESLLSSEIDDYLLTYLFGHINLMNGYQTNAPHPSRRLCFLPT